MGEEKVLISFFGFLEIQVGGLKEFYIKFLIDYMYIVIYCKVVCFSEVSICFCQKKSQVNIGFEQ